MSQLENISCEILILLKALHLKLQLTKEQYSHSPAFEFVNKRATEAVYEELTTTIKKLVNSYGPSDNHKLTAISILSKKLILQTEDVMLTKNEDLIRINELQASINKIQNDSLNRQNDLLKELIQKDQQIEQLKREKLEMETKLHILDATLLKQKSESDKIFNDSLEIQKSALETRLQGLDFKAEIEHRCDNILQSIQSKMGFIPLGIQNQIQHLRILKAPGHDDYNRFRKLSYKIDKKRFTQEDNAGKIGSCFKKSDSSIIEMDPDSQFVNYSLMMSPIRSPKNKSTLRKSTDSSSSTSTSTPSQDQSDNNTNYRLKSFGPSSNNNNLTTNSSQQKENQSIVNSYSENNNTSFSNHNNIDNKNNDNNMNIEEDNRSSSISFDESHSNNNSNNNNNNIFDMSNMSIMISSHNNWLDTENARRKSLKSFNDKNSTNNSNNVKTYDSPRSSSTLRRKKKQQMTNVENQYSPPEQQAVSCADWGVRIL